MARKLERSRYPGLYYRLNAAGERIYTYRVSVNRDGRTAYEWVTCPLGTTIEEAHNWQSAARGGGQKTSIRTKADDAFTAYHDAATANGVLRSSSARNYKSFWSNYLSPVIGNKAIDAVTGADLVRVLARADEHLYSGRNGIRDKRKQNSAASKRVILKVWNQTFAHVTEGTNAVNPSQSIPKASRPRGTKRKRRIVVLTSDQIQTLIARCDEGVAGDEFRIYYLVSIYCGLRIGELLNLQWKHVDFERGILSVVGSAERDEDDEWDVKTDAGDRDVPISPDVLVELRRHRLRTPFSRDEHYVFAKYRGSGEVRHKDAIREKIRRDTADFPQDVRPHILRHTFFSLLGQRGVDIQTAAQIGGHSSERITHDYQQWFDPEARLQEVRDKLAAHYAEISR